jgi:hypothetical protein
MFKNFQKEFDYQFIQKPIMKAPYNLRLFTALYLTLYQYGYNCQFCGRSATYFAFSTHRNFELFLHSGSDNPEDFGGISLFDIIIKHELFLAMPLCINGAVTFYTVNNINE